MAKYIWVGQRESEIHGTGDLFDYTLTTWGSNTNNNISYSAYSGTRIIDISLRNDFFIKTLKQQLQQDDYKILFYNSMLAYTLIQSCPDLLSHIYCVNKKNQLNILNSKIHTRLWLANHLSVIPFTLLTGDECQFSNVQGFFPDNHEFIIQEARSAGGFGTFLMNQYNFEEVQCHLGKSTLYMVSNYVSPALALNVHVLLTKSDIIVFPASIQIIDEHNNNLLYTGADYVSYTYLDINLQAKVSKAAKKIGKLLQKSGYLGICGIDFLSYNDSVYFIEINPRFQASTLVLNQALEENNLPPVQSLQLFF